MKEDFLLERVAWLYYIAKKTQREIASILGINRSKVSRLLKEGEEKGIVEHVVHLYNHQYYPEIEAKLLSLFKLRDCLVVPTLEEKGEDFFADVAAKYVERTIEEGDTVGVAWGLILKEVFSRFKTRKDLSTVTVVQLLGGLSAEGPELNLYDITRYFPGAKCLYLYAPAVVSSSETRRYLVSEPQIQAVFEAMTRVNKAFLGIGGVGPEATLLKVGFINAIQMGAIIEAGGVGDVVGRYFDIEGRPVKTEMDDRIIGISLNQLQNIPVRIGIALGRHKVKAIMGALRGKHINVLVTDYSTATEVLKLAEGELSASTRILF